MNRREQGIKNLELTRPFLRSIIRDPNMLTNIPDGATVVAMPANDEDLFAANLKMASSLEGDVVMVTVEQGTLYTGRRRAEHTLEATANRAIDHPPHGQE